MHYHWRFKHLNIYKLQRIDTYETTLQQNVSSTWCRAVKPSTFAVFMSAPRLRSLATSSVSPLEHAAKNTHPSWNLTFLGLSLGVSAALFVSDSFHRFNCSCLFSRALVCFESSAMTAAPLNTQLSCFLVKIYVQPKMASRRFVQLSNEHWIVLNIKRSTVHHSHRCCVHSRIKEDLEGYFIPLIDLKSYIQTKLSDVMEISRKLGT